MHNFFVHIEKNINNIFWLIQKKIPIGPYLNEKLCWANQKYVDLIKHFSECSEEIELKITTFKMEISPYF